ncbi:dihydrolipoamide acetyltransferase family protein [Pseudonocardia sp.]|uniref:dihydrolipoamide acetyltransferase family protein n=1 Tax=Pseudonocardia sp. TaxID=60912 RepID=UPI0031FE1794
MSAETTLVDVVMPRMGVSVAEGTVATWLKSVGDRVALDESLLEVSTDKVETEVPSPVSGVVVEILVAAGEVVAVGAPVAKVLVSGPATVPPRVEPRVGGSEAGGTAPSPPAPVRTAADVDTLQPGHPARAEPAASRRASAAVVGLAGQLAVDLVDVAGTGPGGRVTREDLLLHVQTSAMRRPAQRPAAEQPRSLGDGEHATSMSPMRREIAHRMRLSVETAVHVTSLIEVDMSSVVAARRDAKTGDAKRPTLLAYVARAVVAVLPKMPWLNAQIRDESIVTIDHVNLGIAVSVDNGSGLLVPVIKNASDLNLAGITARIADLASRVRSRNLSSEDLSGATFTITNLGVFGTFGGTPIINPPQVAVLGMYSMVERPVVVRGVDDSRGIGIRPIMNMSMSYDHRLIDGVTAGAFLRDVRSFLEHWNDEEHL